MNQARERILNRVQKALENSTEKSVPKPDFSANIYNTPIENIKEVLFAENLQRNKSTFFFAESLEEFLTQIKDYLETLAQEYVFVWEDYLRQLLKVADISFLEHDGGFLQAEVGITLCEAFVARTGSILISSKQTAGRRLSIYPEHHIIVGFTSQIVDDIDDGLLEVTRKYKNIPSLITLISGPSQTADIEKTLVLGAHGPKALTVFLIDE